MPTPGPPFDPEAHPEDQRFQALTYAEHRRWLTFHRVTSGSAAARRYVITMNGRARNLLPGEVLAYVTGLADAFDVGDQFPDREDTTAT